MSKTVAGWDRTLFVVLGVVLIALGAWPILVHFDVAFAKNAAQYIDHNSIKSLPQQPWWPWALGAAAVVFAALALWIFVANVRTRRILRVQSAASASEGAVHMQMNSITAGIAKAIADISFINSAKRNIAYERDRPQLTFTLVASAETPAATLGSLVRQVEADFRDAFPDSEIETVYKVHYDQLSAQKPA